MKLKLIILALLLPFSAMAANTNAFDNIKVNVSITDLGSLKVFGVQTNFNGIVVTNYIVATPSERALYQGPFSPSVRFESGFLDLLDSSGNTSIAWGASRSLRDSLGNSSVEYGNRILRNSANIDVADWQLQEFYDNKGSKVYNWTNFTFFVSQFMNSNLTVNGTIFVTNTATGSLSIDGNTNAIIISTTDGIRLRGGQGFRTNTLSGTPQLNLWFTNDNNRLKIKCPLALPATLTSASAVKFMWTLPASGVTNPSSPISGVAGISASGMITNTLVGDAPPNALYSFTNIGVGTPTIVLPDYVEQND